MSKKLGLLLGWALFLTGAAGCSTSETFNLGYVQDENTIALVNEGSSREQVLLALGTPSTTATAENEVFYYISQQKKKSFNFQKGRIVDQRV